MKEIFQKYSDSYLKLPDGLTWSDDIWTCRRGEWTAFFRPLNLGLFYRKITGGNGQFTDSCILPENAKLTKSLIIEKFLNPLGSDEDKSERTNLINKARSGKFRFICILPTTECAFNCAYCHQRPKGGAGRTMSSSEITQGLTKCAELCTDLSKPVDILIYGGEPLLAFEECRRIFHLASKESGLFKQEVRLSFTTSGYGMTIEHAKILKSHDVFVIVSIDSSQPVNDKIRLSKNNASAFNCAEKALDILKSEDCRTGISVTLSVHNIDNLEEHLSFLLHRFQPYDIGLNAFLHSFNAKPNKFQLDAEQSFQAIIRGMEICRELGVFAEQPFRRLKPFVYRKPLLKDCSSPGERLVLTPGGYIGFCDSMYPKGKYFYKTDEFGKADEDYRTWQSLSSPQMPSCKKCPVMTVCGGACRYDAYMASGNLDGIDPLRCEVEKKLLEWMIWELFDKIHRDDEEYIIPSDAERQILFGKISPTPQNQPFTAGSYCD